jgi:flagellar hook-basal body complex protein FliE
MSIEPIAALGSTAPSIEMAATGFVEQQQPSLFAQLMEQATALNDRMQANDASLQSLAMGDTDQLHRVMMNLESTRLRFDLMLQVRNKVLDAYQELMRQQV